MSIGWGLSRHPLPQFAALALALVSPGAEARFRANRVYVTGDRIERVAGGKAVLLSVQAIHQIGPVLSEEVSVFHALILVPDLEMTGGGSSLNRQGSVSTHELRWKPVSAAEPTDEEGWVAIQLQFDAATNSVKIGTATFDINSANLFLVEIDVEWQPSGTSLGTTYFGAGDTAEVLTVLGQALPDSHELKDLLLDRHPDPP